MSDDTEDQIAEIETLPLDAWHRRKGARMVPFAGYHMPIQFEGIVAEHNWTRQQAGLFDVSHMGQLLVSGERAAEELEKLLPGAIASLKPGKVRYSLLVDQDGGILDDLMVTNATPWIDGDEEEGTEGHWGEPAYYLVVNGATNDTATGGLWVGHRHHRPVGQAKCVARPQHTRDRIRVPRNQWTIDATLVGEESWELCPSAKCQYRHTLCL